MTFPVHIQNDYAPLRRVVVGTAHTMVFPDSHEIDREEHASALMKLVTNTVYRLFKGLRVPRFLTRPFEREAAQLVQVLRAHQVEVLRPADVLPRPDEPLGLGQMFSRDPVFCVQDRLIRGQLQIPMRHKETRGFEPLLRTLREQGVSVPDLSLEPGAYLEGGDVIVDLPYVFVGIGKYGSNLLGAQWLQRQLPPELQVVPVRISDESILHLDCALTVIGPGRAVIHRESLEAPLPAPLDGYEFIEVDAQTRQQLGTNLLLLDERTVIVQQRHTRLIQALRAWGYRVIGLNFTWHTLLGGSFRCATMPLVRQ